MTQIQLEAMELPEKNLSRSRDLWESRLCGSCNVNEVGQQWVWG